jgi:hypothetical protein
MYHHNKEHCTGNSRKEIDPGMVRSSRDSFEKSNKKQMKNITTLLLIVMLPVFAFAEQAPDDPNDNAPIDGGLSLLMATGAVYAVKKIRDRDKIYKKKN